MSIANCFLNSSDDEDEQEPSQAIDFPMHNDGELLYSEEDQHETNLEAVISGNVFDPAGVFLENDDVAVTSYFLQNLRREFSSELRSKAYSLFDTIIELRYGESVPESTFATIASELISKSFSLFADQLDAKSLQLVQQINRFAGSLHLQKTYLKSLGGFIPPRAITIPNDVTYQYISIIEIAKLILNQSLVNEILREQSDNVYNFQEYSSELNCEFQRWQQIKGKLRIQLYSDEFSIANPIGHSRHEQNYLVIYCSFTNIPYCERLKRRDLFLLLIVNHKTIDANLLNVVLDQLNQDLGQLIQSGIVKRLSDGSSVTIPCTFSSFVGDSKSAYQFLGFPGSFGLGFRCRFCGASYSQIQTEMDQPLFGSDEDIHEYWRLVDEATEITFSADDEARKRFGLVRKFKFASRNPTESIHPWGVSPPDVCHDLLEGALPKICSIILIGLTKLFLRNKNQMVTMVRSKQFYDSPLSISSETGGFSVDGDFIQRAELFIRLEQIFLEDIPALTGCAAEEVMSSKPFQLYLAFKRVCLISFNVIITDFDLEELKNKIRESIRLLKEIEPSCSITPKLHHLQHYPSLIKRFGPLVFFSSLAFERYVLISCLIISNFI